MGLEDAFNYIISLQATKVSIEDLETSTVVTNILAAPSNYFRNMAGPEEIVVEGREFVFSKKDLDAKSAPTLKRGIKVIHSPTEVETITYVKEMRVMGVIVGYRVRTG